MVRVGEQCALRESRDVLEYDSFRLETVTLSCFGYLIMCYVLPGMLWRFFRTSFLSNEELDLVNV